MTYRCDKCGKRYRRNEPSWSCCVLHSAGECCHFGEIRVTKKGKPKDPHGDASRTVLVVQSDTRWTGTSVTNPRPPYCGGFHTWSDSDKTETFCRVCGDVRKPWHV